MFYLIMIILRRSLSQLCDFVFCKYNTVNDSLLGVTISLFAEVQGQVALEQKPASRHLETLKFRICDFAVRCS